MKIFTLILFLFTVQFIFPQQKYYTFSELRGLEDGNSNTHLFYRMYYSHQTNNSYEMENSIYHLDLNSGSDTLFLLDYAINNVIEITTRTVDDYDFWDKNPNLYIDCGTAGGDPDLSAFIERFDGQSNYNNLAEVKSVNISKQQDSLVIAGVEPFYPLQPDRTIKSVDGGWNWMRVSDYYQFLSLSPSKDSILFARGFLPYKLFKSSDGGNNFQIVDTSATWDDYQFLYDPDNMHIYRVVKNYYSNQYELRISDNYGDSFSWQVHFSDSFKLFLSMDNSQSGKIYLADGRRIYVSDDYGLTFSQFKEFNRSLVGIYKKPNSQLLFAATKYDLYEVTPDTVITLKHLDPDPDIFKWYPLKIGDKWFYQEQVEAYTNALTVEVIGDSLINGKLYYISQYVSPGSQTTYTLERIDTTDGRIYRYINGTDIPFYDFTAQGIGDSVLFNRGNNNGFGWVLESQEPFDQWGINSTKNTYNVLFSGSGYQIYSFVKDLGLYEEQIGGALVTQKILKGFIKDGVVYGDTVLSVNNKKLQAVKSFKLKQNYPNPFNPTTKISWQSPVGSWQTLKVYDVLGREVATLVNEYKPAGKYEVEFNSKNLPSGIYFYRIKAGSFSQTKKMILLK